MIDKNKRKHSKHMKQEIINNSESFKKVPQNTNKRMKKNEKFRTPEQIKRKKKRTLIMLLLIIVFVIIFGIIQAISVNNFKKLIQDMSINESSTVIDSNNKTIAKIGSEMVKNKISSDEIPTELKNAYIAIEDERYYKHGGIDLKRTTSATASYIFHAGKSSFGGSTITQQLVKNLTGDSTSTITRKVKEWKNAIAVESFMSKDEILELYLNIIYVGPNIYGVESGAQYYFSKSAKDLSLEECAFLAGINNSPNSYNPFNDNSSMEKINKRTKIVLSKMLELKYINEDDYNEAINKVDSGLNFKKGKLDADTSIYSYHTDALLSQVIDDISEKKHISKVFATNYINMSGLKIYSTQDSNIQNTIETEFKKNKYQLASKNGGDPSQAAMVIIDHKTGYVTRMCRRIRAKNNISWIQSCYTIC